MRGKLGLRQLGALAAVLALAAAPIPPMAAQTFTESADVVVVEVPVQVVRDGQPVRGLTAADFEVYDGRKKQEVTGFEVLDLETVKSAAAAAEIPAAGRRHFLMLFDLYFAEPSSVLKARTAAADVVDKLHPTDMVAVATYTAAKGPQIVLGFTADRRQIAAALNSLGVPQMLDRNPDPLRLVLADVRNAGNSSVPAKSDNSPAGGDVRGAIDEAAADLAETLVGVSSKAQAAQQQQVIAGMTRSLADLAKLMASIEGRKHVVYLSEGFDAKLVQGNAGVGAGGTASLGDEEQSASAGTNVSESGEVWKVDSTERYGDIKTSNDVEKMLEEFRRADCVIQAVDIAGLRGQGNLGNRRTGGKDTLLNFSKSTGGELYENFNDLSAAMQQMLKRTSVTYVLAFQPDEVKTDGTYRRLRVEVKNQPRGTRVIHRPGYYAPRPYTSLTALEKMLDAANDIASGEEAGAIRTAVLAAPFQVTGEKAYVPVLIEVDGPSLLANTQGTTLPTEIYVYAMDQGGSVHDFVSQTFGLDLAKAGAQLRQTGLKFFGHVDLLPGDYSIRVLVRNGVTGASSLRVLPLKVPAFAQAGPVLLPPFFPEPTNKWLLAREQRENQVQVPYPFLQQDQPYIPASKPVLGAEEEAAVSLVAYNLPAGDLRAQAKVLSRDGKDLGAGELRLLGRESGSPNRLKATFRPPRLEPGEYQLQVTLVDASGATQTSSTPFVVGKGASG